MSPDTARWLLTDGTAELLRTLGGTSATPAAVAGLRKRVGSAERAAAALELAELRVRGRAKFAGADRMFFTRKGLEQATDQWIAAYKASRFAGHLPEHSRLLDACCGVGGDLAALARVAPTVGVDSDPTIALFAERNAATRVEARTLAPDAFADCDAWHADPDRRPAGARTSRPELHEPSLDTLAAWRRITPEAAVKLAPAAQLPDDWRSEAELEWISRGGECRQLVAWCGKLAALPGLRRATRIAADGAAESIEGPPGNLPPAGGELGDWLHEPDPAVLAADLVGAIASDHALAAVSPAVAYLTGRSPVASGLVASFRVIEAMPLDRKRLAGWLAERGIGRLEIKQRGTGVVPERLRQELRPRGDNGATLLVFPDRDGRTRVVVAERWDRGAALSPDGDAVENLGVEPPRPRPPA